MEKRPPTAAMPYTRNAAETAPANAMTGSARKKMPVRPVAIATTAPSAPPADTPMMPGSAIGLRKSPCIVVPATPRAAPTIAPTTMRGSRICSMTSCSVRANSPASMPADESTIHRTCDAGMDTGPMLSEMSAVASVSSPRADAPSASRTATPLCL